MKFSARHIQQAGYTLIEVSVAIGIFLMMLGVFFVVATGYRAGVNRTQCILNRSTIQKSVRSVASMYGLPIGAPLNPTDARLIGTDGMLPEMPACPEFGAYTFATTVPDWGTAYVISCGAGARHNPPDTTGW